MAQVSSAAIPDTANLFVALHLSADFDERLQMAVQSFDERPIRELVPHDHYFTPARSGFVSKDDYTLCRSVHRQTTIGIPATGTIPICTKMTVCAELLRVVPSGFIFGGLGPGAKRIIKTV